MPSFNLCQPEGTGLSCFGCCGHSYSTKRDILEAIKHNTLEFKEYSSMEDFMNRSDELWDCGICRNVIYLEKDKVGCPLHPDKLGVDIRIGHCDTEYLCKPFKTFKHWQISLKEEFISFIKKLEKDGMGWYEYSILMDSGKILELFRTKNHKNWRFSSKKT